MKIDKPQFQHKSGIYQIRNLVNGKVYVGSSVLIRRRYTEHVWCLKANWHPNLHLQSTWNKYGASNFTFEILLVCEYVKEELLYYEQKFLDLKQSHKSEFGYNTCSIAGNTLGVLCSEDKKRKISKANSGKVRSEEFKRRISQINKGRPAWNKGIPSSNETKRKVASTSMFRSRGNKSAVATISEEIVVQFYSEYLRSSPPIAISKLAKKFGIKSYIAYQIVSKVSWSWLTDSIDLELV